MPDAGCWEVPFSFGSPLEGVFTGGLALLGGFRPSALSFLSGDGPVASAPDLRPVRFAALAGEALRALDLERERARFLLPLRGLRVLLRVTVSYLGSG